MRLCKCGHGRNKHMHGPSPEVEGSCRGVHGLPCACSMYQEDGELFTRLTPEMAMLKAKRAIEEAFPDQAVQLLAVLDAAVARARIVEDALHLANGAREMMTTLSPPSRLGEMARARLGEELTYMARRAGVELRR